MSAEKKKQMGVLGLIITLVVILIAGVLFVGAVSGWFDDPKVALDAESMCEGGCEMVEIDGPKYESLVNGKRSFVLFVDQEGCTTADKLEEFIKKWATDKGVKVYKTSFSDMKETSLHENVKYYPSFVVVSNGKPRAWLRADEDADADAYNDETAFREWADRYVK